MALPTYVGHGALAGSIVDATPDLPTGWAENDIFILICESAHQAVSTPTDWTLLGANGTGTAGDTAATRLTVFWRRATATEASPTVTDPGDHIAAVICAIRGCVTSGDPVNVTAGDNVATDETSVIIPGATTTVADCLVLALASNALDSATDQYNNDFANADLATVTKRAGLNTASGNGGGFIIVTGEKATAGAYGATTGTQAIGTRQARRSIALTPATDIGPLYEGTLGDMGFEFGLGALSGSYEIGGHHRPLVGVGI